MSAASTSRQVQAPRVVPLTVLVSVAMFASAMLASWLGQALNRENETVELSWTRPLPRAVLALRYIAIDLCALAIAFAATLAGLVVLVGATLHAAVIAESRVGVALVLGTAVVAMWYALTLALSAGVRGRGGAIAWLLWPIAFILIALAQTHGGILHDVAVVLDVINPFAYLGQIGHNAPDGSPLPLVWSLDEWLRGTIVWAFAVAFGAAAVAIWQRREI